MVDSRKEDNYLKIVDIKVTHTFQVVAKHILIATAMGTFPFTFKATTTVKHMLRATGPSYSAANKLKVVST